MALERGEGGGACKGGGKERVDRVRGEKGYEERGREERAGGGRGQMEREGERAI